MGRGVRLALRALRDYLIHSFHSIDEEAEAQRVEWTASSEVSEAEAPSRVRLFMTSPSPSVFHVLTPPQLVGVCGEAPNGGKPLQKKCRSWAFSTW